MPAPRSLSATPVGPKNPRFVHSCAPNHPNPPTHLNPIPVDAHRHIAYNAPMEMSEESRCGVPIVRWSEGRSCDADDQVVAEEPLEIRLNDAPFAVTMRTPGDDQA